MALLNNVFEEMEIIMACITLPRETYLKNIWLLTEHVETWPDNDDHR